MTLQQERRISTWELHQSQRGYFAFALYAAMLSNERIRVVTADLGYKVLDFHREDFPDRFLNTGASEQAAAGICVGMAMEGLIPIFYSITSFLLYRPLEWHRNFLQHEGIPVRLVGSGLDDDYKHDGITHQTFDAKDFLKLFPRIQTHFPTDKEEVAPMLQTMIDTNEPSFLCLRR